MTPEQKELLLKDLCARLPYGVKVLYDNQVKELQYIEAVYNEVKLLDSTMNYTVDIEEVKPYLFPLSSMTEEQKNELVDLEWSFDSDNSKICNILECFGTYRAYVDHSCCSELIDWFHKNHFDYRGLIEQGLAIDATELNIY